MSFYKKVKNYTKRAYFLGHYPNLFEVLFSKKDKYIYYGFLGDGNFGDELVYEATRELFKDEIIIPYKKHMPIILQILIKLRPQIVSGAVIGGGTLFRIFYANTEVYHKVYDLKNKVFFHGTGTDHLINQPFWARTALVKNIFGGVRGPLSKEVTDENNYNLGILGDAAFCLFKNGENSFKREKSILVNYGTHAQHEGLFGKSRESIEEFINSKYTEGYEILYLPFHNNDVKLGEDLIKRIPKVKMLQIPNSYSEALKCFQKSEFAIGERLHFNVMCAMANIPFASINYARKHSDFLDSIGGLDFGFEIADVSFNGIVKLFTERNRIYNWNSINKKLEFYKEKQYEQKNDFINNN